MNTHTIPQQDKVSAAHAQVQWKCPSLVAVERRAELFPSSYSIVSHGQPVNALLRELEGVGTLAYNTIFDKYFKTDSYLSESMWLAGSKLILGIQVRLEKLTYVDS